MRRSAPLRGLPGGRPADDKAIEMVEPPAQRPADLHLAEQVERALRTTGYTPLRAVEVAVCDGRVRLRGRVPSYYLKQLAQAAIRTVPGVRELRNDVDVAGAAR